MKRSMGVLLHLTSLPGLYGCGSMGSEAIAFMDWLKAAKQSYWQILPLSPPDFVNSPYASSSAFAGNVLLIDIDSLCSDGLIEKDIDPSLLYQSDEADFARAMQIKTPLFRQAYANYIKRGDVKGFASFKRRNAFWLKDFAVYSAIKASNNLPWYEWDTDLKTRDKKTLKKYIADNRDEIDYHCFLQYIFDEQWKVFRHEMRIRGLKVMGDIPMYVSYDSADVWANTDLFLLKENLKPHKVAGVPPDYFSEDGQLWGNPIYNWQRMREDNYKWWVKRVKRCRDLYDCLRIDHFRAFDAFWQVNSGAKNARKGRWIKGEGYKLVKLLMDSVPSLEIVAEDLGVMTDSLNELIKKTGLPGMKVLQFAFDGNPHNSFLPHNYNGNCVAYLGTHDNDTTVGWWKSVSDDERHTAYCYAGMESDYEINRKLLKLLARSKADLVIVTMQDVIGCDSDRRMNIPSTIGGLNWRFILKDGEMRRTDSDFLASLVAMYCRD